MKIWGGVLLVSLLALMPGAPAGAAIFPVPDSVRKMSAPHEEGHVLRGTDEAPLGEQRSIAKVKDGRLVVECLTRFTNGESWDERAVMDLAPEGYRARSFHKIGRANGGATIAEQKIDFTSGDVQWLADGKRSAAKLTLEPDTYIGPMMGVILAAVPGAPQGTASFHTVVFRPDPSVYLLRADVVAHENYQVGKLTEPTTKMRLRADLGPVQNTLFASMIPTHYFWFTRDTPPEFFAFEGSLGYGGPELRMVPQLPPARTALAR